MKFLQLLLIAVASLALFACGGDPSSGGGASISLNGGAGVNQDPIYDGNGGSLDVYSAGDIRLSKSGSPDAVFTAYANEQPDFGANKVTVSSDTTVILDPGGDPGPGVLYARSYDQNLYVGGGADSVVTGLEVAQGATLRLPENYAGFGAFLYFADNVVIGGTVTTATGSINLELGSESLVVITTTGKVTNMTTFAENYTGGIWLFSYGALVNLGSIDCSGARGGGSAGYVFLYADGNILNAGSITAKGGDGDGDNSRGGWGGSIEMVSGHARIFSSGALNADGGAGTGGPGGGAGYIRIAAAAGVDMVYSLITLNGGSGAANGGQGGWVSFLQVPVDASTPTTGSMSNEVPVTVRGGNGANSGGNRGGDGGGVFAIPYVTTEGSFSMANVTNSGVIEVSGGAGDIGGNGGEFCFSAADKVINSAAITGNGGEGATQGGNGAAFTYLNAGNHTDNSGAISANGGAATTNGGNGGLIWLFSMNAPPTTNTGALSVVKGSGGTTAINGIINIDWNTVTSASGAIHFAGIHDKRVKRTKTPGGGPRRPLSFGYLNL